MAVKEVNEDKLSLLGHSLDFIVAETYGDEVNSIRQTASLWTKQIVAYIGPQETCIHEGRMAAAFNLPMISYVSKAANVFYNFGLMRHLKLYLSTAHIVTRLISRIFPHLQELVLRIPKYPNLLFRYCWHLIGLR